jgi:thioredoxin reductase
LRDLRHPLPAFRNKTLIVVGGGDTAEWRKPRFYATRQSFVSIAAINFALQRSCRRRRFKTKITFIWNTGIEEILGTQEDGVKAVRLQNLEADAEPSSLVQRFRSNWAQAKH